MTNITNQIAIVNANARISSCAITFFEHYELMNEKETRKPQEVKTNNSEQLQKALRDILSCKV